MKFIHNISKAIKNMEIIERLEAMQLSGIFAKSLDGLPRAWVRIPPTPPTMAIGSRRNPRAILFFGAIDVNAP